MEEQPGDDPAPFFQFLATRLFHMEQLENFAPMLDSNSDYPRDQYWRSMGKQLSCYLTKDDPSYKEHCSRQSASFADVLW
jgi:hypothetical protein